MSLPIFELDQSLYGVQGQIWDRVNGYRWWKNNLEENEGGLEKFAEGYKTFGWNKTAKGYIFREWLPNAKQVFLIGEHNKWENTMPLKAEEFGRWSIEIPDKPDGSPGIPHRTQHRIRIETHDGQWFDRVPAWTKLAWQDATTLLFNGVFWEPPKKERYVMRHDRPPKPAALKIYEAHVGMSSVDPKINTYWEFADNVLPRIKQLGYNAVQLMAVAEHAHYGCFGYHVTSFFAPASRSGTPEEFKYMVDKAHGMGIQVLIDLVHAHCSSNQIDGIAAQDGTDCCYTHAGEKGKHTQWDSSLFNYLKTEVCRFLLSNIHWWLHEYGVDGFRFDGISSMLYHSHAIGKGYTGGYHEYFGGDADVDSHIYLMLANDIIHSTVPSAVSVAEDVSGMPTIGRPVEEGGFGFDYRLAMAIPDMFIKLLKECGDDGWGMGHICHTLTNRRWKEGVIAYAESHDQAIVGDKSIAFWLMDAEMYTGMSCLEPPSMCVDRGMALHKMIRLLVLGLGGEGYLNFIGNEFGHPEWVDFPREGNDWSYHHCRRRFDLADMDHLRYKYLEKFDVLMQQAENRFNWCSSDHQYVTLKNEMDKVIAFERGDCLFVFNFHHSSSYTDYGIGCTWNENMRVVLDTDEGWFGGHHRLDWGHGNGHKPGGGLQSRYHSVNLYLPARTGQVLVRESLLKGGVKIKFTDYFLKEHGVDATDLTLVMEDGTFMIPTADGVCHLAQNWNATFMLKNKVTSTTLPCMASLDGQYRVYFPGTYWIDRLGYIEAVKSEQFEEGSAAPEAVENTPSKKVESAPQPEIKVQKEPEVMVQLIEPDASDIMKLAQKVVEQPTPVPEPQPVEQPKPVPYAAPYEPPKPAVSGGYSAASEFTPVEREAVKEMAPAKTPSAPVYEKDPADDENSSPLRRLPSGCHLSSLPVDIKDQKLPMSGREDPSLEGLPTSYKDEIQIRRTLLNKASHAMGDGGLLTFARSYSSFGLHYTKSKDTWSYIEWIPGAKEVYLMGDFNQWSRSSVPLRKDAKSDLWGGVIDSTYGKRLVPGSKYKIHVVPEDGGDPFDCMPAWCRQVVMNPDISQLDACVPDTASSMASSFKCWRDGADLRIYEVHVAMTKPKEGAHCGSFAEVRKLLPRVARDGYTAILLIGVSTTDENTPIGGKNKNLFAPEYRFGNSEDVKKLISEAHDLGIRMLMSVDHVTAMAANDCIPGRYCKADSRLFDYEEMEVLRVLLGNLAYWMEEFGFDGFRFQSVENILYKHQGRFPPSDHENVEEYVTGTNENNRAGVTYLMLANELVRALGGVTIADDHTLYPDLCKSASDLGLGFHFRQSRNGNEILQYLLRTKRDEEWGMTELVDALRYSKYHRPDEKIVTSTEAVAECCQSMRPLRIAMFAWETLHTIAAGGVAPHVTELAADLHKLGHEVHIFTRSTQPRTWEHEVWGVWYHEVHFDTSPDFVREIENMCAALVGDCMRYEGATGTRFDIIHGHDWLAAKCLTPLKQGNRKVIFTMHSTETGRCGNVAYGGQSARIREIEGEGCHVADRVICVSGVLADEVKNYYGIGGDKIRVVYNGIIADSIINMEWQDHWTGNTKKDKGFNVMDPVFLFVGRLAVQKGPDLLIDAIPNILQCRGDAKFIIVGDGHMKGALEARVNQLGIGHAVVFTGSVKSGSDHLKALFKSCDAVIVPSRNEPFGIVVLEAWAAGKPVVATTCGGPRDFVTPGQDGFLVDPEPGSIAWGCCNILNDFDQAKRMGQGAQQKALYQFSWSNIAMQTHDNYYEQLGMLGCPFNPRLDVGCPLASFLIGNARHQMGVFCDDIIADRGINLTKLTRLLVTSFANDANLTCMGSEFGFPDTFDARKHANMNSNRIRYDEADEKGLRYKHIELWEACMHRLAKLLKWNSVSDVDVLVQDDNEKVLAYSRGPCLFAFNFHPANEVKKYKIRYPGGSSGTELQAVLDSDDARFNGKDRGAKTVVVEKDKYVTLSLGPRTAVVLASKDAPGMKDLSNDKVLSIVNVDDFVDLLAGKTFAPPPKQ